MKVIDPLLKAPEEAGKFHLADHDKGKRHRDSSHTSGEEGYDSINSDEELQAGDEAVQARHLPLSLSLSLRSALSTTSDDDLQAGLSVISSGRLEDGFPLSRKLSLNGDSEDSGVNRDGPASLASSSGSSCGPPTFQELKVTSDLSATASPKRATFTIGTPKQLSTESPSSPERAASFTLGVSPRHSPDDGLTPCTRSREATPVRLTQSAPAAASRGAATNESSKVPDAQRLVSVDHDELRSAGWDRAVAEAKEQAFSRLQDELQKANQELRLRDEEVTRLSRIREQVEAELEDLTASLFQEAHNMVRDANTRQAAAERSLAEARMQVDVLTAEVAALKTLVLTSTPARPNPHLHPQIDKTKSCDDSGGGGLFRKHRRSPSHFNLKYGRENSPPDSPVKEQQSYSAPVGQTTSSAQEHVELKDGLEVDPSVHREFVIWRQCPTIDRSDPFVARVYREDIDLCLDFNNRELAERVGRAVETGNIFIEAVGDRSKTAFPKKCALLEAPRQCHYRMKLGDQDTWHCISQICRNRITAVIDFLNYLRYIERGLVKSSVHDIYWEIVRLRKEMCLARLGLMLSS